MAISPVLRWLIRTAALSLSRRRRSERLSPPWTPAALALGAMLSGFVIVATSVGLPAAAHWIALGLSVAAALSGIALALVRVRHRHLVFAATGWTILAIAIWTIVASAGTFDSATARWVVLGSGIAYVVGSLCALVAHELSPARFVHVLEVRPGPRPKAGPPRP